MTGEAPARPEAPEAVRDRLAPGWHRWVLRLFWILPLGLYAATAAPGMTWIDGPMIANHVYSGNRGIWVNNHNLFRVAGRAWTLLLPVLDLHYALNLFCAVLGAVTVYLIFLTGYKLTSNLAAAAGGGVALMVSHSLWWHSTALEVYTMNTAILAAMLYFVVRYDETRRLPDLYKAVFCLGLGSSNHALMGLFVAGFAALWLARRQWRVLWRPRVLATTVFFFLAGFQLFVFVFIDDFGHRMKNRGEPTQALKADVLREAVHDATGGKFKDRMFPEYSAAKKWKWRLNYLFTWSMNYPSVAFPLGWIGIWAFWRNRRRRLSLYFFAAGFAVQLLWSANYMIWDMYAFGLPVWVMFGLLVILGADAVLRAGAWPRRLLLGLAPTVLVTPWLYASIVGWAQDDGFWSRYFSTFDHVENMWDAPRYFADPNKWGYDAPNRVAERMLDALPSGAHLFDSDGKGYYPLALYQQRVLRRRRDVRFHSIFGPFLDAAKTKRLAGLLRRLLDSGEDVFIASPYWPERNVLDELYVTIAREQGLRRTPYALSPEELERTFPLYRLERVPLADAEPLFFYRMVPRADESPTPAAP